MADSPPPRLDLLDADAYRVGAVQTTRGCPFSCEFCDIIVTYGRKVRMKPIENVVRELQTDSLPLPDGHPCLLPFFIPCPNRSGGTHTAGSSDGFVMNPGPNARSASALSFYQFLGKLVGIAVRHGLQLGLQLSPLVWRVVAGLPLGVEDLLQVDARAPAPGRSGSNPPAGAETVAASDGSTCLTLPDNVAGPSLAHRAALARLRESEPQLAAFRSGIASVVPVELR